MVAKKKLVFSRRKPHTCPGGLGATLACAPSCRATSTMPVPTTWHPGEVEAQQARGWEEDVWGGWQGYEEGAPEWMVAFLQQLRFLSVTTLDADARPWASLLSHDGKPGFIVPNKDLLHFTIRAPPATPIRECLLRLHAAYQAGEKPWKDEAEEEPYPAFQIAAVGVMLDNRRRNKMEGVIVSVEHIPTNEREDTFQFAMRATSTFGNCPKCACVNDGRKEPLVDLPLPLSRL